MANTTYNLTESLPVSDEFNSSISPERFVVSIDDDEIIITDDIVDIHTIRTINIEEDAIVIGEEFSELHTIRTIVPIEDGLAIGEVFGFVLNYVFIYNIRDTVSLREEFSETHSIRTIVPIRDTVGLTDDLIFNVNDRYDFDLIDNLGLEDITTEKGTDRFERTIPDTILIADNVLQGFGIIIEEPISGGGLGFIDGLSFGSFLSGTTTQLSITLNPNWIFLKWDFSKSGIVNIYDPNTTLIVPIGGGIITPIFINIGVIVLSFNSIIIVLDPNFLEYNADPDGDYISTTEKITIAGDAVTVARHNITIEQGSTFQNIVVYRDVDGNPVDLTGYTAEMQVRKTKESSTIILTLNTSNGRLILGGTAGTITIVIPGDITDALDFVWGRYDLELYPNGDTTQAIRILEGKVNLSKQVTQ